MKLLLITLILGASISIERHVIEANGAAQYIGPCDVSFCSACFVFCGVPPYTCKAKITAKAGVISPCEIDPICEVCQDLCPKEIGDAGCPAHACPSDPNYQCPPDGIETTDGPVIPTEPLDTTTPDAGTTTPDLVETMTQKAGATTTDPVETTTREAATTTTACPESQPGPGGSCGGFQEFLSCGYDEECCCGDCFDAIVCECSGTQWACFSTDACLEAPCAEETTTPDATTTPEGGDPEDFDNIVDAKVIQKAQLSNGTDVESRSNTGNLTIDAGESGSSYTLEYNFTLREAGIVSLSTVSDLIQQVTCFSEVDEQGNVTNSYVDIQLLSGLEFGSPQDLFPVGFLLVVNSDTFGPCLLRESSTETGSFWGPDGFLLIEALVLLTDESGDIVRVNGKSKDYFSMFDRARFSGQKIVESSSRRDLALDVGISVQTEKNNGPFNQKLTINGNVRVDVDNFEIDYGFFDGLIIAMETIGGYRYDLGYAFSYELPGGKVFRPREEYPWIAQRLPWAIEIPARARRLIDDLLDEFFEGYDLPPLRFGLFFEVPVVTGPFEAKAKLSWDARIRCNKPNVFGYKMRYQRRFLGLFPGQWTLESLDLDTSESTCNVVMPSLGPVPIAADFFFSAFAGIEPQLRLNLFSLAYLAFKQPVGITGKTTIRATGFQPYSKPGGPDEIFPLVNDVCENKHLIRLALTAGTGQAKLVAKVDVGNVVFNYEILSPLQFSFFYAVANFCLIDISCSERGCPAGQKCCGEGADKICIDEDSCCAEDRCGFGGNCCPGEQNCCVGVCVNSECNSPAPPSSPRSPSAGDPTPQPNRSPSGGGGGGGPPAVSLPTSAPIEYEGSGSTTGDPHITTFDGAKYDCQGDGEFVLTRSLDSGLSIQGRFTRTSPSQYPMVTTGVVVAEQDGPTVQISVARTISPETLSVSDCPIDLYVDGSLRSILSGSGKNDKVKVARRRNGIYIAFVTTDLLVRVKVHKSGTFGCFMNILPYIPASVAGESFVGLYGSLNGNQTDDFMDTDGKVLDLAEMGLLPSDWCTAYWCLRDENESMFSYEPGLTFSDYENCDSDFERPDYNFSAASPELITFCAGSIACLIDGIEGGLQDAQITLEAEVEAASGGRPLPLCFETNEELREAVLEYTADSSNGTLVATLYGWPIGTWCVLAITDFSDIFINIRGFNEELDGWDVSAGENFDSMFRLASDFNQNLTAWNMSSAEILDSMFAQATAFDGDVSTWDVSNVNSMGGVFASARSFNQDLSSWNTSSVQSMRALFVNAIAFNPQSLPWDVSQVTDMENVFAGATKFNGNITKWNTSSVVFFKSMFEGATAFNQDLDWDTSAAIFFTEMFASSSFNGDIGAWNVSSGKSFIKMFQNNRVFNRDISTWDISNAESMTSMFENAAAFNVDISGWQVSKVFSARYWFKGASSFKQNLCPWGIQWQPSAFGSSEMFVGTNCDFQDTPGFLSSTAPGPFCFDCTVGLTEPSCIGSNTLLREATRAYDENNGPETYVVKLFGAPMGTWCLDGVTDFTYVFLDQTVTDNLRSWDTSKVIIMDNTFTNARFTPEVGIQDWDVSSVESFDECFSQVTGLDLDFSLWNVSSATKMNRMFASSSFTGRGLETWDVSRVTEMGGMFVLSPVNVDLSLWNVSKVEYAWSMFALAGSFNQSLCNWGTLWQGRSVDVWRMFQDASLCESKDDPDLLLPTPSPFCYNCTG